MTVRELLSKIESPDYEHEVWCYDSTDTHCVSGRREAISCMLGDKLCEDRICIHYVEECVCFVIIIHLKDIHLKEVET